MQMKPPAPSPTAEPNPFTDPKIAEQWANSVEGEKDLWRDQTLYPALRNWVTTLPRNSTILDIGSGQGRIAAEIGGYGKYVGVEPSTFLTERAKTLYPADNREFVLGDAYNLPLPDNSVEGVISINVWFHLGDIDRASAELARVLKSGGAFFITTADNDSLETWKSLYINPVIDDKKMEGEVIVPINNMSRNTFYFHTNHEIANKLKEQGLEVVAMTKSLELKGRTLFVTFEGKKL